MNNQSKFIVFLVLILGLLVGIIIASAVFRNSDKFTIGKKIGTVKNGRETPSGPYFTEGQTGDEVHTGITPGKGVLELQQAFVAVADKARPAVVNISTTNRVASDQGTMRGFDDDTMKRFFGDDYKKFFDQHPDMQATALGSGFIVNKDGYILTNFHVVRNATAISIKLNDGRTFNANIVGTDNKTDLAVLKIDAKGAPLPFVTFGDSDKMRVGEWVIAIGNPFGLEQTVTSGILSAKDRVIGVCPYDDFLQTDASINPGNSGGPLFDIYGNVEGVNSAIFTTTGATMGIGFAIPINMAKAVLEQLIKYGEIKRGWLGVSISEVTPDYQKKLHLNIHKGVVVVDVKQGPGADADMRAGDVITVFNNKPVANPRELQTLVAATSTGQTVPVNVIREGSEKTLQVTIGKMPEEFGCKQQ